MPASGSPDDLLAADALERLFVCLNDAEGILAAVSGGPDSMALMHLLAIWKSAGSRPPITIATVDHGLRPEAAQEAAFVAREAKALGLPHRTLAWTGPKPPSGLQEAARNARYDLLIRHARELSATHLLTAHTLDDQAETILMRMARGSGLAGLAGMRAERDRDGIRHVRPLLDYPKTALLDLCRIKAWSFVADPSNADERFTRVRWRSLMPGLAAEGLTAERLAGLSHRALLAEEALDAKARDALARAQIARTQDGISCRAQGFADEPFEIALRMLIQALREAGLALENSRLQRLEACLERLRRALAEGGTLRLTVAGALVHLDRRGGLSIGPEPERRRGR